MAPKPVEDDFMATLFADLDASVFDALPSSSPAQPLKRRPPRASQPTTLTPPPPSPRLPNNKSLRTALSANAKGKGKGKAVDRTPGRKILQVKDVNVEELFDGMDWDEPLAPSQPGPSTLRPIPRSRQFQRCEVLSVDEHMSPISKRLVKELTVSVPDVEEPRVVLLCDDWITTPVEPGDTVNVIGTFTSDSTPTLTINLSSGALILHPDILVSSTKVADSSHCTRKAILQELIRTVGDSSPALVYGNMLHELLQACMTDNEWSLEWRERKAKEIAVREIQTLWTIQLEVDKCVEMLLEKSKGFEAFRDLFVGTSPSKEAYLTDARVKDKNRSRIAVTETIAIEEDIWSPKYGLKGKVDVSVSGRLAEGPFVTDPKTLPFEIKTGRAVAGMEHRAQTMLYTLLMSERYDEDIDSGLLYYSQSPTDVFRVKANRNEIRGLLLARNEFATFLHRRMTLEDVESPVTGLLPKPIDDVRSCKRCYVSKSCMLYRKAIEGDESICDDTNSPEYQLQQLYEDDMGHLTSEQAVFFRKWERLISLEEQELVRFKKEIWTMTAHERQKVGRPHQTRERRNPFLEGMLSVNDPVVVSLEEPAVLAISRGFILAVTADHVVLGLDHSLTAIPLAARSSPKLPPSRYVFRVDKDELAAGLGRIRDNLMQLFVPDGDERRRELVVDLRPPEFVNVQSHSKLIPSNLNDDQVRAVEKVLSAKDYALVLGMPGTGKTTTIAHLLRALASAGKSVLLTSYTHSAVDNILLKLSDLDLKILRLGNRDKVMPALHKYTLDPADPSTTLAQLDDRLMKPQIVATTALAINEPIFTRRRFDVCIVDEASQITLPTCLGPLRFARTFILVGDHNQLPPLVRNRAARQGGLDVSLFKRLSEAHPNSIVHLSQQYRMNDDIMLLSNKLIYDDKLVAGSEAVSNQTLALPKRNAFLAQHSHHQDACWLTEVLRDERKVVFVDTDALPARERKVGSMIDNETEARLVVETVEALIESGVSESDVGVIALYRQQIKTISRRLEVSHPDVEVLTADRSQGRDKAVIVMSLTRSNPDGITGDLLQDWRRVNVCITRAKSKLVFFGSRGTLVHVDLLKTFFELLDGKGWIYKLPSGAHERHSPLPTTSPIKRLVEANGSPRKRARKGAGVLVLSQPLITDVINSL